jgi:hypothetical protein
VVIVIRVVLGLIAAFFIVFGLRFMLMPDAMAAEFFITPVGISGLSTMRADLGGAFLGIGACIALGLFGRGAQWLYAAALILAVIAVGRLVGFAADGTTQSAITALVAEVVFAVLLLIGARRLGGTSN